MFAAYLLSPDNLGLQGQRIIVPARTVLRRVHRQNQMEEKTTRADDRDKQRSTFRCSAN
jgi:hypothetical protein